MKGTTLSEELHTPPLPVTRVFLGYRWSYNESATTLQARRLDNDRQSFRSCLRFDVSKGLPMQHALRCFLLFGGRRNPCGDSSRQGEAKG